MDEYKNTCHCSFGKKPVDADYSDMSVKIETNPKAPNPKVGDRFRITNYKNNLAKVTPTIGQKKYLLLILG